MENVLTITKAEVDDLEELLELQYLAYQSEAKRLNNWSIPPLKQTIEELQNEYKNGTILKALNKENKIIGSIRSHGEDGTLYVGKLFVHPEWQGQGIGTRLLNEIERICPYNRYELFTSSKSEQNIRLYEKVGYQQFKEAQISPVLKFVYMEKRQ